MVIATHKWFFVRLKHCYHHDRQQYLHKLYLKFLSIFQKKDYFTPQH